MARWTVGWLGAAAAAGMVLGGLAWPLRAVAVDPVEIWGQTTETGIPDGFQAWHSQYESVGDYGESWFFMVHNADGGALFAMMSVTNLGLRTFDGSVDVQYYPPSGEPRTFHKELRRADISGSTEKMDMTIGGARCWGGHGTYDLEIEEPGVSLDVHFVNRLPSYRFGDGILTFWEDRSAEYAFGMSLPSGRATGSLTIGGQTYAIDGQGYHDHGWSTIKLPTFIKAWTAIRLLSEELDLVLHHQRFTPRFGSIDNKFGVLGVDGKRVASSKGFALTPTATRTVDGVAMPTAFDVKLEAGGWKVTGTIAEARFQDSVDVLAQVSLPVRMAIKAFYSNPRLQRYVGRYELDVTSPDGTTAHRAGECLVEADVY